MTATDENRPLAGRGMSRDVRIAVRFVGRKRSCTADLRVRLAAAARGVDLLGALRSIAPRFEGDDRHQASLWDAAGPIDDDTELAGRLYDGAVLTFGGPTPHRSIPDPSSLGLDGLQLVITGGLDAGTCIAVDRRPLVVGRDVGCDVRLANRTVSGRHALVGIGPGGALELADQGSVNGIYVNERRLASTGRAAPGEVVRLGTVELEIQEAGPDDRPIGMRAFDRPLDPLTSASSCAFNRPPRTQTIAPTVAIEAPRPPPPSVGRAPFRAAAVVIPLLFAVLLVSVTRQWIFALFAGMSPVMMTANTISDRRSNRDRSRRELARFRGELDAFDRELAAAAAHDRARRRAALPDLADVARRAIEPSRSLWERRASHADFLQLRVGVGDPTWEPPLLSPIPPGHADVRRIAERHARLPVTPIAVDLRAGRIVGIAGPRGVTVAVARALVAQIAVHHGPGDVQLAFALDAGREQTWDWAKWLPHGNPPSTAATGVAAAVGAEAFDQLGAGLGAGLGADPVTVVVVDARPSTLHGSPVLRSRLGDPRQPIAAIVVADNVDELPANCTTVVRGATDAGSALASIHEAGNGTAAHEVLLNGLSDRRARTIARALARFRDPERVDSSVGISPDVSLLALLGMVPDGRSPLDRSLAATIATQWLARPADARPTAPLGVSNRGPLTIDLVTDGPHVLIGGTTGSGKSELLRSLVVGLATVSSPEQLNFVLIDYKGGSAFDACARLPHVVGVVTDLDESGSARAVRCLEAELRWREQVLRDAGVSDRDAFVRLTDERRCASRLPRLALIVDEFATLKAELPAFVDALVDVAQRGRSLGVHLVLATQRPAGTVSDRIRANTELKIALRVQDRADSNDVIGSPMAALLPRARSGMAVVRVGSDEPITIQTAYTGRAAKRGDARPVQLRPFRLVDRPGRTPPVASLRAGARTELDVLVDAALEAAVMLGDRPPRRPWPEPLPDRLAFDSLVEQRAWASASLDGSTDNPLSGGPSSDGAAVDRAAVDRAAVGIVDDPDRQRLLPLAWELRAGNLLLIGSAGAGTSRALASLAAALDDGPSGPHVYAVHAGPAPIEQMAARANVGDVIALADRARVDRLVRELSTEVQRRVRNDDRDHADRPRIVLMIDGMLAVRTELDDPTVPNNTWELLLKVLADGPAVDVISALTIDRPSVVSGPIGALGEQRWIFRLADRIDYSLFGLRQAEVPAMPDGRCIVGSTGLVAQVAEPPEPGPPTTTTTKRARPIRVLPTQVTVGDLDTAATQLSARPWRIGIGLSDATLTTTAVELHAGEHLRVCGPSRCGRSSTLAALAQAVRIRQTGQEDRQAPARLRVACLAPGRSPLPTWLDNDFRATDASIELLMLRDASEVAQLAPEDDRSTLLLVDDAELIDDPTGALTAIAHAERPDLAIVAAVRAELLRSNYNHWARSLRRSRTAILLRPGDVDAELTGIAVPRRGIPTTLGRGFLARDGELSVIQFALPGRAGDDGSLAALAAETR